MSDRVTDMAFSLADSVARSDIECLCRSVLESGDEPQNVEQFYLSWYEVIDLPDADDADAVKTALEYLELRGMLRRHPTNTHLVRIRDEACDQARREIGE